MGVNKIGMSSSLGNRGKCCFLTNQKELESNVNFAS